MSNTEEQRDEEIDDRARRRGLEVANYELAERLDNAERKLRQLGYRRCDMIACNCKGYHRDGSE